METLTSSRIVPIPRFTFRVARSRDPNDEGDLPSLFRGFDIRRRRDFDERDAEPVESVDDFSFRLPQFARGVFLEEDRRDSDSLSIDLEASVERHEPGPLEPRCVRSVDHDLAHEVDLVDRLRIEQEGDFQRDV